MPESRTFFAELIRRHVVTASIAHLLVGWLFVHFSDVIFAYLGMDVDEPVRWALIISVAAFPVTVVIAWFIEHPWHRYTGNRLLIDVIMIIAIILFAWSWAYRNFPATG